jgi:hypothetical protein
MAKGNKNTPTPDMAELGATGLQRQSGYVFEEQLRELKGQLWTRKVREMVDNDSTVGAILYAIEMLARQTNWEVVGFDESNEAKADAEFFQTAMFDDMSHTWSDMLGEMLTMLPFGWCYMEEVYKRREGDTNDPSTRSRYKDNKIGWRKWSIRAQETLTKWDFDESGGVQAMRQRTAPDYVERVIPIQKAQLHRTTSRKGNPEGRSILRNAYKDYYFKSTIGRIEAIGIERDLAGLPVALVPPELFSSNATGEQQAILAEIKKIVTNIRRDEQEGLVFPLKYDGAGKPMYEFKLLSSGGSRQFDTDKIYQRYNTGMAVSILADFLFLGHEGTGSYALSMDKTQIFSTALSGFLDSICDVVNRYSIPRLARFNGMQTEKLPKLQHGKVEAVDLKQLGDFIKSVSGAGFDLPAVDGLLSNLLERAGLPVPEDEEEMDRKDNGEDEETDAENRNKESDEAEEEDGA